MRVSEKTLELTICSQLTWVLAPRRIAWTTPNPLHLNPQPLWFGLTQRQEARSGFVAATRIGQGRLLLLQFKAGRRLQNGNIRYVAPHRQLMSLQRRLNNHRRLVFYVLPQITRTRELQGTNAWILATTWFLDVAAIPDLAPPARRSQAHNFTLNSKSGVVLIHSQPVEAPATKATDLVDTFGWSSLGTKYPDFQKFWSYAKHIRHLGVAIALPAGPA